MSLMALVANVANGPLRGNPQAFPYSPSWKRHATSAFSFVEAELDADGRVGVPARSFDLLGECFLELGVRGDRPSSLSLTGLRASDVVAACSFSVDGRTVEAFTGEALDVAGAGPVHVRHGDGEAQLVLGPLPFFFCSGPQQFANVFESGATVRIELAAAFRRERDRESSSDGSSSGGSDGSSDSDGSDDGSDGRGSSGGGKSRHNFARLVYKAVQLDCGERQSATRDAPRLRCLSEVHTAHATAGRDRTLRVALPFDGLMKDLRVAVAEGGYHGYFETSDRVRRVELRLNGRTHASVSGLVASQALAAGAGGGGGAPQRPRSGEGVLHIPFCNDPSDDEPTSHVNFGRVDAKELVLRVERQGSYRVTVVGRRWEVLEGRAPLDIPPCM